MLSTNNNSINTMQQENDGRYHGTELVMLYDYKVSSVCNRLSVLINHFLRASTGVVMGQENLATTHFTHLWEPYHSASVVCRHTT